MTNSASPSLHLTRAEWSRLRESDLVGLDEADLDRARGLGDEVNLTEVREVYLPLARLIQLHLAATRSLAQARADFLRLDPRLALHPPFVIGIAGSVAVGKSTTSRLLQMLLARGLERPNVALVPTDGFLLPNAELARRGVRKGFPESYDRRALLAFVRDLKAGAPQVKAPVYSHMRYDIVRGQSVVIREPDIVLLEGLNVLQPARADREGTALAVSDYFDLSIYVDADTDDIAQWYVQRFLRLRETAFRDPNSYFHRYATLDSEAAVQVARELWAGINLPNLLENIRPTRDRATLVLHKGHDHTVTEVRLRR